jgi:predicted membrane protein
MARRTRDPNRVDLEVEVRPETPPETPAPYREPPPGEIETVSAFLGSVSRAGEWEPPERLRAVAFMGRAQLDFTEALLPPGVTEIRAVALMGRVEIVVPARIELEVGGTAMLGGIDHRSAGGRVGRYVRRLVRPRREEDEPGEDEEVPVLWIRGTAVMGRIAVRVR